LRLVAVLLCALAGYIDAVGFIALGGFFVSFMSGNSTRLGVGLARDWGAAAEAAGLILTFVAGVVIGALVWQRTRSRAAVPTLVAALLFLAALTGVLGWTPLATVLMGLAMGAENILFSQEGEVRVGLTYMTGTLVKIGQRVAATILGGDPFAWAPFLLLWVGLVAGGALGALAYQALGMHALWFAAAAAALVAAFVARIDPAAFD
jgi:uncharacterized membrane protein YoaK (UPF0700 family)